MRSDRVTAGILGPHTVANERDTGDGHGSQYWNSGLCSARRQDELEERHRIAELRLEWTERAVPSSDDKSRSLDQQRGD